jgi:hypothetical protein
MAGMVGLLIVFVVILLVVALRLKPRPRFCGACNHPRRRHVPQVVDGVLLPPYHCADCGRSCLW